MIHLDRRTMKIKYAELQNPLFLAGTNFGLKLDVNRKQGLVMLYDRKEKELLVMYNNETAIVPTTNVASMVEGDAKAAEQSKVGFVGKFKAQVSTPMGIKERE